MDALEAKAQRMTREGMEKMRLCEEDLAKMPKGDKREVMLAAELCVNTTMTKEWIARRLRMGNSMVFKLAIGKNIDANMTIRLISDPFPQRDFLLGCHLSEDLTGHRIAGRCP